MDETRWLTAKQAALKLGVSSTRVRDLCQQGRVKGAEMLGAAVGWMIPDPPVVVGKSGELRGSYVTVPEAAHIMGISRQRLSVLCIEGKIKGATQRDGYYWSIPFPIERLRRPPGRRPKQAPVAQSDPA